MFLEQSMLYSSGKYFKDRNEKTGEYFRYSEIDTRRKEYGEVINNLIGAQGFLTISTNWDLEFKVKGVVLTQDDKTYFVEGIQKMLKRNPQSLSILKKGMDVEIVLVLKEIDNYMELE